MNSFPWNSVNRDRLYDASDFRTCFKAFFDNGVFPFGGNQLQIVSKAAMVIAAKKGTCLIDGIVACQENDLNITIGAAHSTLNRIDRIVARRTESLRSCDIIVLKGTAASQPVAPAISRNADIYDLCLAEVRINAGTTEINQAMITDTRLNNNVCGLVTGAVESVDTTSLFDQMQSWLTNETASLENTVMTWFNNLKVKIDENVAVNLQNQIDAMLLRIDSLDKNKAEKTALAADVKTLNNSINKLKKDTGSYYRTSDGFGQEFYLGNGYYLCQHITATGYISSDSINFYASWHRNWEAIIFAPIPTSSNCGFGDYTSGYACVNTYTTSGCNGYVSDVIPGHYTRIYLWYIAKGPIK